MDTIEKAKKGVQWTTLSTFTQIGSQILKISILTRFLDKSDFGLVALVTVLLGFCNLFADLGFTTGILHRQNITQKEYSSLYWANFLFSIILYAVVVFLGPFISDFYNQPEMVQIIPIICVNVIISSIGRQFRTVCYKELRFKIVSLIDVVSEVVSLLVAFTLAIFGYGVYSRVLSVVFQCLTSNLVLLICNIRLHPITFEYSTECLKPFLKIGVYQVGAQTLNYFSRDLDVLIIGKFLGTDLLGGYSLAKQLVMRPYSVLTPIINKVAAPYYATLQNDYNILRKQYFKSVGLVTGVNTLVYLLVCLFAYPIVYILYGKQYVDITIVVQILCLFMLDRAIGNPIGSLLAATGKTHLDFIWNLIYMFIIPVFIFIGIMLGSTTYIALMMDLCSILLFYPNWRLVIRPILGGSFTEYVSTIFNYSQSFGLALREFSKIIK